jgi:hypothetical protein
MTREEFFLLGLFMALTPVASIAVHAFLVRHAAKARALVANRPPNSPEHIMANDALTSSVFWLVVTLASLGVGVIFVVALVTSPIAPGVRAPVGVLAWALIAILMTVSLVALFAGLVAWVNLRRLDHAMFQMRTNCTETTFEGCPFITEERLTTLREKAAAVTIEIETIQSEMTAHLEGK